MSTTLENLDTSAAPATEPYPHRWLGVFAVLAATLMNLLDTSVVNVGGPAIRRDLGGGYATLQWIAAGYTLALAVGLLTGGRLGDMFGRKRMLMIGAAGFVATSVACALATSPEMLVSSRVAQGLFGAMMIPQGFGLIRDMFPPAEIGKAFGAFGPIIGLASILGPIVAGLLVDADILGTGWRMIFLINVPLGGFAMMVGAKVLPSAKPGRTTRLDGIGTLIAGTAMFMLVYPLVQGRELGWPAWSLALMIGSLPVFAIFAAYQLRRKRSGATPLVEPSVFAKRSYTSGVVFVVVFFGAVVGFGLALGMFLQLGQGYTPLHASLTMAAFAVGAFLGTGFGATQMARLGRIILHIGLGTMSVGLTALLGVLAWAGTGVADWALVAPLLVYGAGMGMIFVPLFDIIMADVEDHEVGSAAGALESLQQLGASLGIAVLGTIFFGKIGAHLPGTSAHRWDGLHAAELTIGITLGLTMVAFAVGFLLPKKARAHQ